MNIILLSGGSGKRLWPLSNDIRAKQFIKVFHNDNGNAESMLERMYRQVKHICKDASITIATSEIQAPIIHEQLGNNVDISIEPDKKDTFPAIVLACQYLKDRKGLKDDEPVVVCPIDPYVDDDYFEALNELDNYIRVSSSNIALLGIQPTCPSSKYGYIIPDLDKTSYGKFSPVLKFKEKPSTEAAEKYIKDGALWNGGVFAFKLGYILQVAHSLIDFVDYQDLFSKYKFLERLSFDYAVLENEKNIDVMRFNGSWKDIGTWDSLTEVMDCNLVGEALIGNNCNNVHIINELDIPILCMGISNMVISANADGILISDKGESSNIKAFVDKINIE